MANANEVLTSKQNRWRQLGKAVDTVHVDESEEIRRRLDDTIHGYESAWQDRDIAVASVGRLRKGTHDAVGPATQQVEALVLLLAAAGNGRYARISSIVEPLDYDRLELGCQLGEMFKDDTDLAFLARLVTSKCVSAREKVTALAKAEDEVTAAEAKIKASNVLLDKAFKAAEWFIQDTPSAVEARRLMKQRRSRKAKGASGGATTPATATPAVATPAATAPAAEHATKAA